MKLMLYLLLSMMYSVLILSSGTVSESTTILETHEPEVHSEPEAGGLTNVFVGYGLVLFGVTLSTLGALTLYVDPILVKLKLVNPKFKISEYDPFLAFTLAFSGGVLLETIFVNLLTEGYHNFESSKLFPNFNVKLLASLYFIFWMFFIMSIKIFFRRRSLRNQSRNQSCENKKDEMNEFELDLVTGAVTYNHVEAIDNRTNLNSVEGYNRNNDADLPLDSHTNVNLTEEATVKRVNVGYEIAIAIAIHNFPEGVITFLAAYQSVKGGLVFGLALALHKFPEGLMMGIPIVMQTKSKFKAVVISFCASFFTQILGATTAHLVSRYFWNDIIAALLFLLAAAILTITLFDGIMPLAKSKDKDNKYFVPGVIFGISCFLILNSILDG